MPESLCTRLLRLDPICSVFWTLVHPGVRPSRFAVGIVLVVGESFVDVKCRWIPIDVGKRMHQSGGFGGAGR